ncbi:hypothetical protein AB0M47_42375 [Hamadaea sp. NPDC051192]|uniref:hypothetical protein n=1 Tax=Hamadaea sp. NPDC051192 TaxID=3154940 RepID=UPI0034323A83
MTILRRSWYHPRNRPKTVPELYALVVAFENGRALHVVVEGPAPADEDSYQLMAGGPDGLLRRTHHEGHGDRWGRVLVGTFDLPPAGSVPLTVQVTATTPDGETRTVMSVETTTLAYESD